MKKSKTPPTPRASAASTSASGDTRRNVAAAAGTRRGATTKPLPPGFIHPPDPSKFREFAGPIYYKRGRNGPIFGMWIQRKHGNRGGPLHGGVTATLADVAMGYGTVLTHGNTMRLVTVNLNVNYLGSGNLGDWIEAHVDIKKVGRRVVFCSCDIWCARTRIAHATGAFAVV